MIQLFRILRQARASNFRRSNFTIQLQSQRFSGPKSIRIMNNGIALGASLSRKSSSKTCRIYVHKFPQFAYESRKKWNKIFSTCMACTENLNRARISNMILFSMYKYFLLPIMVKTRTIHL